MNKLHTVLLATALCSIAHGLTASQEEQKPFFSVEAKNRCKAITQRIAPFYAGASVVGVLSNGWKHFINPQLNLIHRSTFENKHNLSPSKFVNFHKANAKLFAGLVISAPFVFAGLLAYDSYHQGFSTVKYLAPSEHQEEQKIFFDEPTLDRFKTIGQCYGYGYVGAASLLNFHNIVQILVHKEQGDVHRKWFFMPIEYGQYARGSSKIGNIFKGKAVILKTLAKTVPVSLPIAVITAFLFNAYEQIPSEK